MAQRRRQQTGDQRVRQQADEGLHRGRGAALTASVGATRLLGIPALRPQLGIRWIAFDRRVQRLDVLEVGGVALRALSGLHRIELLRTHRNPARLARRDGERPLFDQQDSLERLRAARG